MVENLAEENFTLPLLLLKEGVDDPEEKDVAIVGEEGYYRHDRK